MIFKPLERKDYKIKIKKGKFKLKRVVPTQRVTITNTETGETDNGVSMDFSKGEWRDVTTFVKCFRPNLIDQMKFSDLRLFCFIMEKMNRFGVVELDPGSPELYEYTGYKCKEQLYRSIKNLKDISVIIGPVMNCAHYWKISDGCISKTENGKREHDGRPFVKIYEPRALLGLSAVELSMFSYVCVKMDYEGCVKMVYEDFRDMTGYKLYGISRGREKYVRSRTQFSIAKRGLVDKDFMRDMTTMVDDGERMRRGQWFRVNPNIFIKGNRMEAGYGIDDE